VPGGKLTLLPLIAATYFIVAGGPFGLEDIVSKSGYAGAILILLITPIIWALPTALMVAELASAFPEEGGYYVYVTRGLGRFCGFQEAWLSLVGSIFDMAIYPTLFVSYLSHFIPSATSGWKGFAVGAGLIALAALWNLMGVKIVGESSVILGALLLAPFAVLTVCALFHRAGVAHPAVAHPIALRNADILGGILVAMWNYMGWDNTSTIASDVDRPQRTYPLAMAASVTLIALTYVLPVAAIGATGLDPNRWSTGGWADVAGAVIPGAFGAALALSITLVGMIAAFGTLNALTLTLARLPVVLAEDRYLPKVFTKKNASGAPWVSTLVCAAAWALCLTLSFVKLIVLDVLLTGLSILLQFAALAALRIREPELPRPFRVPGGTLAAVALGISPLGLLALTAARNQIEPIGPINALELGGMLIAAGAGLYFVKSYFIKAL
jgi:amino acid transporter